MNCDVNRGVEREKITRERGLRKEGARNGTRAGREEKDGQRIADDRQRLTRGQGSAALGERPRQRIELVADDELLVVEDVEHVLRLEKVHASEPRRHEAGRACSVKRNEHGAGRSGRIVVFRLVRTHGNSPITPSYGDAPRELPLVDKYPEDWPRSKCGSQFEVEGEVLAPQLSVINTFFAASFLGISLHTVPFAPVAGNGAIGAAVTGCDAAMLLVEGDACIDAEQTCLHYLDPPPYQNLRCGEYAKPSKCRGERVHRRFCIDREEYADSTKLPVVSKNWNEAQALCDARGARLCREPEWEFACEGTEMSPYPYGFKRDSTRCNFDKTDLGGAEEKLKDLRATTDAYPDCLSPFGVHDMVGNVDEWVEGSPGNKTVLRGGWWLPGRNRCRASTTGHGEEYSGKQVGFRCCREAPAP